MPARRGERFRIGVTGLGERQEIAPGVYINTVYRGCTPGFVVTKEGLILIDTPLIPKQARDWREQIEMEEHRYLSRWGGGLFRKSCDLQSETDGHRHVSRPYQR